MRAFPFAVAGLLFLGAVPPLAPLWGQNRPPRAIATPTATQTYFATQRSANQINFAFAWRDKAGQPQQLAFSLPVADLARGAREFTLLDNAALQAHTIAAMQAALTPAPQQNIRLGAIPTAPTAITVPAGVSVTIQPHTNGYRIGVRGPEPLITPAFIKPLTAKLNAVGKQASQNYLHSHWYVEADDTHIMPDHPRIAARYAPALAPVAQAVLGQTVGMDTRARTNWLLGWLQTIPYNTLQNRATSNGAGFQTPYGLFLGNKGDCDTKSVALAALLRRLYPGLKLAMLYTPGHAFVGVGMPQGPHDFALNLKGTVYVLAEPTGPRPMALGQVAPEALGHLQQGQFTFLPIP